MTYPWHIIRNERAAQVWSQRETLDETRSMIRLEALRIDRTVLISTKQISSATLAAVQDMAQRGVHEVLVWIRTPSALRLLMERLGIRGFAIAYTGMLVCRLHADPGIPTAKLGEHRMSLSAARRAPPTSEQ